MCVYVLCVLRVVCGAGRWVGGFLCAGVCCVACVVCGGGGCVGICACVFVCLCVRVRVIVDGQKQWKKCAKNQRHALAPVDHTYAVLVGQCAGDGEQTKKRTQERRENIVVFA